MITFLHYAINPPPRAPLFPFCAWDRSGSAPDQRFAYCAPSLPTVPQMARVIKTYIPDFRYAVLTGFDEPSPTFRCHTPTLLRVD